MLLSEKELEISDEHSGIIELPADTEIGVPCAKVMGLDDPVLKLLLPQIEAIALASAASLEIWLPVVLVY